VYCYICSIKKQQHNNEPKKIRSSNQFRAINKIFTSMSSPSQIVTVDDIIISGSGQQQQRLSNRHRKVKISVEAPSDLPEGYTIDVLNDEDGRVVTVTVPKGGVKSGQIFESDVIVAMSNVDDHYDHDDPLVVVATAVNVVEATEVTPMMGNNSNNNNNYDDNDNDNDDDFGAFTDPAPYGVWKDGLCDCCVMGPCHPSLWCAIWCPQLLMGQVLTRMHMTWWGGGGSGSGGNGSSSSSSSSSSTEYRSTFPTLVLFTMIYFFVRFWLPGGHHRHHPLMRLFNILYIVYMVVVMSKLRRRVRQRYQIPSQQQCCGGVCEDVCCVVFCGCCTISQLARQTVMYDQRRAVPCSSTGLPENASRTLVIRSGTITTSSYSTGGARGSKARSAAGGVLPEQRVTLIV
jgi:Cys-rich protein (TIGR01571 family)